MARSLELISVTVVVDRNELGGENEGGVRRNDSASALLAVGKMRGDGELSLLANAHAENTLVPAGDDSSSAKGELDGLASLDGGVEHGAVLKLAGVVHRHGVALSGLLGALLGRNLLENA